jgi:hypothetical protein
VTCGKRQLTTSNAQWAGHNGQGATDNAEATIGSCQLLVVLLDGRSSRMLMCEYYHKRAFGVLQPFGQIEWIF